MSHIWAQRFIYFPSFYSRDNWCISLFKWNIGPFGSVTYKWSFGFHDFFSLLICYFWVNVHFGVGTVVSISWWILSRNSPLVCTNVLVLVRCISKFGLLILCGFMCRLCAVQWFWFQKYCYSCQINRLYI